MRQTAPLMILLATTAACAAISTIQNFSAKAETKNVEIVEPFTPETGTTEESEIVIISETDPTTAYIPATTSAPIVTSAQETEKPEIDVNDFYWMAHLVTGEVQGESWDCQVATASVILNRVHHKNYPNTIPGVIKDRKNGIQYACYWDGNFQRKPTDKNIKAARYVLKNGSQIPSKVIYQGQHIIGHLWKKIGSEYFCYE